MTITLAALQIFIGLMIIAFLLDRIGKQMMRQNQLREAELRARGVEFDAIHK